MSTEKVERMEQGEICVICEKELAEEYGRPVACENCGGDAVLAENAEDE